MWLLGYEQGSREDLSQDHTRRADIFDVLSQVTDHHMEEVMSDHHTSYTINAMIGRLYAKNAAFQSLPFKEQQSIVLELLAESYRSDVNTPEMLSNAYFLDDNETNETRTLSTIFKICSYCKKAKDEVEDYGDQYTRQGFCVECATQAFSEDELEEERITPSV